MFLWMIIDTLDRFKFDFYFDKNESYFCLCIVNIHIACENDSYYFVKNMYK